MENLQILFLESVHPVLQERLESAGFTCVLRYEASREELKKEISRYYGIVLRSRITLDDDLLGHCSSLQFIARSGSGLDNIEVAAAMSRGIEIFNSPEGNRDAVAEHATGMLLMLKNHLHRADREVRQGKWLREENRGTEIAGKTIGIIGYGVMGTAFARRLQGFDCTILAYDKYKKGFGNDPVRESTPEEIFYQADVVSVHLPLTPETRYYIDSEFIRKFRKPVILINTSRGKVADTSAIIEGLRSGKIAGACLDVLEYEKGSLEGLETDINPDLEYLRKSEKVVLTPHIAGWTVESYFKLSDVLADKILTWYHRKSQN